MRSWRCLASLSMLRLTGVPISLYMLLWPWTSKLRVFFWDITQPLLGMGGHVWSDQIWLKKLWQLDKTCRHMSAQIRTLEGSLYTIRSGRAAHKLLAKRNSEIQSCQVQNVKEYHLACKACAVRYVGPRRSSYYSWLNRKWQSCLSPTKNREQIENRAVPDDCGVLAQPYSQSIGHSRLRPQRCPCLLGPLDLQSQTLQMLDIGESRFWIPWQVFGLEIEDIWSAIGLHHT